MVISFGSQEGAMNWLDQTGCTFDMFLDEDRQIYTAMGLGISIAKVWSIATLMYYADMKAMGRVLPSAAENIQDDPLQMGGNLVLDCHGNTVLVHCSKTPPDRPTVDSLIDILKDLELPKSSRPEFEDDDEPLKKIQKR